MPPEPDTAEMPTGLRRAGRGRKRTLEAHFAVAALAVDGDPWPVRYAGLDVYHHGPDFDDASVATWEVQCTMGAGALQLEVRHEYSLEITTRDGRRFAGRAFTQHASSEVCTLLDVGEPLDGLEPTDYLD
jgi:hypothetical protein